VALGTSALNLAGSILDHEHIAVFLDDESRYEYIVAHLQAGLRAGYSCVYLTEDPESHALEKLLEFGIEEGALQGSRLQIFDVNKIYVDDFRENQMINMCMNFYQTARAKGCRGWLVVRSLSDFFTRRRLLLDKFLAYEQMFEQTRLPVKMTCVYPILRMTQSEIFAAIKSHQNYVTAFAAGPSQKLFEQTFDDVVSTMLGGAVSSVLKNRLLANGHFDPSSVAEGLREILGGGDQVLFETIAKGLAGRLAQDDHTDGHESISSSAYSR